MTEEQEYQYTFYRIADNLEEIPLYVSCKYEDIPWKMRQIAKMYWGDRIEEVFQSGCLVPFYIRNIDTRECLIAK